MDNILLMQELVKNYHKDNGQPRCAIKMDLMKAYDSVDWNFVLDMMRVMEFPNQFILWVEACITSPMFSIFINDFYHFSGLQPNMQKSAIFFVGVEPAYKEALRLVLPIREGSLPVKYLGVPLISTRLRAHDCAQMKEKTLVGIQSWSNKTLTCGGQLQLIQSVLFSIQIYWSSIFILPQRVLNDIEQLLRSFLWFGPNLKHSGAKVAWHAVCVPKEEDKLGLRMLKTWNTASMMRHLWAICKKADTLWIKWIHTFILKSHSVWRVKIPRGFLTVRKLLKFRDEIQP
ncbi:uncharacterized protein LOC131299748 [Rhododendron vialii]|uniref:uncharacterized protein LOC131299748 n=1 Tax=Rhododendron vialii TaxID=182163 RepID=UPI00265E7F41|nr:uncharacterized protein LOC131299748 [Rhododendron vialii]